MTLAVAFLVRSAPPAIDGVGEYTAHLARALRQWGVDARVFTSPGRDAPAEPARGIRPVVRRWTGKAAAQAIAAEPGFAPDWCCFQYVPQMYGRRGICWAAARVPLALRRTLRCRVATTFHEFAPTSTARLTDAILGGLMRLQARSLLDGCDLAVTTCARYVDGLRSLAPRGPAVVNIPVGANVMPAAVSDERLSLLRERHGLLGSRVFATFGRLAPFRNYPHAIRALAVARGEGLDARLLLLGCVESSNPALFVELRNIARELGVEEQVLVTGELSAETVSAYLQLAHVFLFPQSDGVSTRNTTVMTALAHGLPIVAYTPVPGNFDGHCIPCGAMVSPGGGAEAFARAAVILLREAGHLGGRGRANAAYYEEHFSWPRIADLYVRALSPAGGRP